MQTANLLLITSDPKAGPALESRVLKPAGYEVTLVADPKVAIDLVNNDFPDLVLISEVFKDSNGLDWAALILQKRPHLPVILLSADSSSTVLHRSLQLGIVDVISLLANSEQFLAVVERGLQKSKHWQEITQLEILRATRSLRHQIDNLQIVQRIGRTVTASLDLDSVLSNVVDAAVDLTGAEEGSLLLLDKSSGELYIRAAKNINDEFVRTFRLPIQDTLAGQVLRTGQPLLVDAKTPQKIKTAYLVYNLMYVPLQCRGRIIGVLGIDNRQSGHPFQQEHIALVSALADYAAVAIENANLFTHAEMERSKLEAILTQVEDGVIVVDLDGRVVLVNQTAHSVFQLGEIHPVGHPVREIIHHPELLEIFDEHRTHPSRNEIAMEDGRVFNAQSTAISGVGLAVTMQEITHLKELDRIKSDFVHTVSHDLRSPLTAILGYVELIERAGPTTEQQRDFIRRVQFSVNNITALINDLLDLGRIEAGFDTRKEIVHIAMIVNYATEGLRSRLAEKQQDLVIRLPENLPAILGNPVQLRQMVSNLLGNAIKYTSPKGQIEIQGRAEGGQLIIQITDNGPGIPVSDQPFIFDKFYRGSNISYDIPGTGLGLAIVKSIVESHQGRIWVDSVVGRGSTFTIVLPVIEIGP
jgi:two-component system NtrC family sensor kinase